MVTNMRKRGGNDVVVGVLLIAVMIGVGDLSAQGTPPPGSPGPTQPNATAQQAPGSPTAPVQSQRKAPGAPGKGAAVLPPGADPAKQMPPEIVAPPDAAATARCQRLTNIGERDACMKRSPGAVGTAPRQ